MEATNKDLPITIGLASPLLDEIRQNRQLILQSGSIDGMPEINLYQHHYTEYQYHILKLTFHILEFLYENTRALERDM